MTEAEAIGACVDLRGRGWFAYSYPRDGVWRVAAAETEGGELATLETVSDVEEYIVRRSVAWMLRNGSVLMQEGKRR